MSRANISPRRRERYLQRYGAVAPAVVDEREDVTPGLVEEVLAARCPGCGYTYEVAAGDEHEGFAAGTAWAEIPADWCCPDCGVRDKRDFIPFDPSRAVA